MNKLFLGLFLMVSISTTAFADSNFSRLNALLKNSQTVGSCSITVSNSDFEFGTEANKRTLPSMDVIVGTRGWGPIKAKIIQEPVIDYGAVYNYENSTSISYELFTATLFGNLDHATQLRFFHDGSGKIVLIQRQKMGMFTGDDGKITVQRPEDICK
jgi:hypothetical protein